MSWRRKVLHTATRGLRSDNGHLHIGGGKVAAWSSSAHQWRVLAHWPRLAVPALRERTKIFLLVHCGPSQARACFTGRTGPIKNLAIQSLWDRALNKQDYSGSGRLLPINLSEWHAVIPSCHAASSAAAMTFCTASKTALDTAVDAIGRGVVDTIRNGKNAWRHDTALDLQRRGSA